MLRPYWKCIQALNEESEIGLEEYLKRFEELRLVNMHLKKDWDYVNLFNTDTL